MAKEDEGKSKACADGRHESQDPKSCVWCKCSCHYLKAPQL